MHSDLSDFIMTVKGAMRFQPTRERVRYVADNMANTWALIHGVPLSREMVDQAVRTLEAECGVTIGEPEVITSRQHQPWLASRRTAVNWYYWNRQCKVLHKKGIPASVINALDSVTDRTLDLMGDPMLAGPWDRRGMVFGNVQSGKTQNYSALIAKAADAGYKVIIVIAGLQENLRSQTQGRMDESILGVDSSELLTNRITTRRPVGVGLIDNQRSPTALTTTNRDFHASLANSLNLKLRNLREPAVFVVKKNVRVLRQLVSWLKAHNAELGSERISEPLLLIDDEADNASVNTALKSRITAINEQIRSLLTLFDRSAYVAYTATPFANVFIDPESVDAMVGDDLFPRDYIVALDPPSNYVGAKEVFLEGPEAFLRSIADADGRFPQSVTKAVGAAYQLPASLKTAIAAYLLARAIRSERGEINFHSSMLINVSPIKMVHDRLKAEIFGYLRHLENGVSALDEFAPRDCDGLTCVEYLQQVFHEQYPECGVDWGLIRSKLREVIGSTEVRAINGTSADALDYASNTRGLHVIAVGGYALSRGLTLEGLTVSYIHRNSNMYDTLLQMGRWFGYRDGYVDLCRIWMPDQMKGWYSHIADAVEELRSDVKDMMRRNATPRQVGIKIKSHPANLIITAKNKMLSSKEVPVQIGLGNRLLETYVVPMDSASVGHNLAIGRRFLDELASKSIVSFNAGGYGYLVSDVRVETIIQFLAEYRCAKDLWGGNPDQVREYVRKNMSHLTLWDVFVPSPRTTKAVAAQLNGTPIHPQERSAEVNTERQTLSLLGNGRLSSRGIEKAGIEDVVITELDQLHKGKAADRHYRARRTKPLFMLHFVKTKDGVQPDMVLGWGVSFPPNADEESVIYCVNRDYTANGANLGYEHLDEDEDLGE